MILKRFLFVGGVLWLMGYFFFCCSADSKAQKKAKAIDEFRNELQSNSLFCGLQLIPIMNPNDRVRNTRSHRWHLLGNVQSEGAREEMAILIEKLGLQADIKMGIGVNSEKDGAGNSKFREETSIDELKKVFHFTTDPPWDASLTMDYGTTWILDVDSGAIWRSIGGQDNPKYRKDISIVANRPAFSSQRQVAFSVLNDSLVMFLDGIKAPESERLESPRTLVSHIPLGVTEHVEFMLSDTERGITNHFSGTLYADYSDLRLAISCQPTTGRKKYAGQIQFEGLPVTNLVVIDESFRQVTPEEFILDAQPRRDASELVKQDRTLVDDRKKE